jgi:two-component system response regulator FixJ
MHRLNQTIHVIDDERSIREALTFLLEASGYRVVTWTDGSAFIAARDEPGSHEVILLDVRMARMSGLEVQQALIAAHDPTPVIILTGHADVAMAVQAIKAGAHDFIEKPFEPDALLAVIRDALERSRSLESNRRRGIEAEERVATLSPRERDVLSGLVRGGSNKTIAIELGISHRTVEIYRASLMSKLVANSLSDVLRTAMLAGVDRELI